MGKREAFGGLMPRSNQGPDGEKSPPFNLTRSPEKRDSRVGKSYEGPRIPAMPGWAA